MTGADVDSGDFQNITKLYPAATDYPTFRGQHLYYGDVEARGNLKFKAHGCSGDIRGSRGYLIPQGDGILRIWGAVTTRRPPQFPFPVQLMLFSEEELGTGQSVPSPIRAADKKTTKEWAQLAQDAEQRLYTAKHGDRNRMHFDALRFWAYRWQGNMGVALDAWLSRVYEVSDQMHSHIPIIDSAPPFSLTEARTTAMSVATYLWSGRAGRQHDHSTEAQRRRVLKRWHGRGDFIQELNVKAMHTAIRIDYGRGLSVSDIAQNSIYGPRHIQRLVQEERAKAFAQRNDFVRAHVAGGASALATAHAFGLSKRHVNRILQSGT